MSYLTDSEKRLLFSALDREKEVCSKIDNENGKTTDDPILLVPIVERLERKFYYDKFEKDIKNLTIEAIAQQFKKENVAPKVYERIFRMIQLGETDFHEVTMFIDTLYCNLIDEVATKIKEKTNESI